MSATPDRGQLTTAEQILGKFAPGPPIDDSDLPSVLKSFHVAEYFYYHRSDIILNRTSIIGTLAVDGDGNLNIPGQLRERKPGSQSDNLSLVFDTSDRSHNWFGWELRNGKDYFAVYSGRAAVGYAVHYNKDLQGTISTDRPITEEREERWLNHLIASFISNPNITEGLARVRSERENVQKEIKDLQLKRLTAEGLSSKEIRLLNDYINIGLKLSPWQSRQPTEHPD